jgi:hypothetical protein
VQIDVEEACALVDRAQLARLLDVEQRRAVDTELRDARVRVACNGELATLGVASRVAPSPSRERSFAVADVRGEIGARVLALAAIELLKPEPAEPPAAPPKSVASVAPSLPVPPPAVPPPRHVRLLAVGTTQTFGLEPPLFGGGIAVDYLRLSRLAFRLGFDVAVSDRAYDLGRAHVQLTTFNAQAGYLAQHRDWSARAFVGYRLGAARISGTPSPGVLAQGGTVAGAWGGPLISGAVGLGSRSLIAELGMEAGLVSIPLEGRVEGDDPIALDRYWLSLNVSVGALL